MLRVVLNRLGVGDSLPADKEYYACPCCLQAYPREAVNAGILTEEHVPLRGLGGHGLLLTCATCNNNSGTNFDTHAITRSDSDDFMRGRVNGRVLPATFYADGIPLRGTAQWSDDSRVQLFGVPKKNDRKVEAAHFEALNSYVESRDPNPNYSLTVHTRFDETRARISWIRSAYLAAFAALGWSYIFREVMDPFRSQLKQPDSKILPTYILRNPSASPTEKRVLLVDHPEELRCVAVMLGEHTVFLPSLFHPMTCEELVQAFARRREPGDVLSAQLAGKEVPWPKRPTYFLDRPAET